MSLRKRRPLELEARGLAQPGRRVRVSLGDGHRLSRFHGRRVARESRRRDLRGPEIRLPRCSTGQAVGPAVFRHRGPDSADRTLSDIIDAGMSFETGAVVDGKYKLVRLLGEGGMGVVWVAEHAFLHKHVALKLLRPELSDQHEVLARFSQEARTTSRLEHENIVRVHD